MKKSIIILIILISSLQVNSANLVFNQILTFSGINSNAASSFQYFIVPLNKVWKIEYLRNTTFNVASGSLLKVSTGNGFVDLPDHSGMNNYVVAPPSIWLKSNDTIKLEYPYNTLGLKYMISIIEYNIVP